MNNTVLKYTKADLISLLCNPQVFDLSQTVSKETLSNADVRYFPETEDEGKLVTYNIMFYHVTTSRGYCPRQ